MLFGLVDCNNFYVSCERVFNPVLREVPVAILSNNDGCIIARSEEVKAMGIPMAAPYFKHRRALEEAGVRIFSSNYALYGDMSRRVMQVLEEFAPRVEVYSIDEAFLRYDVLPDAEAVARRVRAAVLKRTGIPTSVGMARTKTLAKAAARFAKKDPSRGGVCVLTEENEEVLLSDLKMHDVWGIGHRRAASLKAASSGQEEIQTAWQLRGASDDWVRRHLTVVELRTIYELRGRSCLPLEESPAPRKSILSSRSFREAVEKLDALQEAVAAYMTRAAEKLRAQGSLATSVLVYLSVKGGRHSSRKATVSLSAPTAYTPQLIRVAHSGLGTIYEEGCGYKKAGVMLAGLVPEAGWQQQLFSSRDHDCEGRLMRAVDAVNRKWGRGTVRFAAVGERRPSWRMRQDHRSPRYTTRWEEVPVANA